MTCARVGALREYVAAAAPGLAEEAEAIASSLLPEFERYGELIGSSDGRTVGLLTRGEEASFTTRIQALMHEWCLPAEAIRAHAALARAFEHKRCFLKLEWRASPGGVERLLAVYYRRRPRVADAIRIACDSSLPSGHFLELSRLLAKDTVHFVCLTARPRQPMYHKMYFSQYVTAESRDAVRIRIARALQRFAPQPAAVARWAAYHDRLVTPLSEQTLFVSLALTPQGLDPSIKIDYPNVPPNVAVGVLEQAQQAPVAEQFRKLCVRAGRTDLSFLGLRLGRARVPMLKGYADFV